MESNWIELIDQAWDRRKELISKQCTDSWRVFHGYEEGVRGVVIEKFGDMAIIEYKHDIRDQIPQITEGLLAKHDFKLVVAKGNQRIGLRLNQRLFTAHGCFEDAPKFAQEFGVYYALMADAVHNCGLYVDARPVRRWLLDNSRDCRVLNLFAFVGSLGVAASKGGAKEVIHLDKSKELLPRIQQSYERNGLRFDLRNFLQGDIYKHLPKAIKRGQSFDGIVLDPPPKVYKSPHSKHRPQGQDFASLVKYCAKLLNTNGWLICMYHRFDATWDESDNEIVEASLQTLKICERFTSECDFPESNPEKKLRVSIFRKLS